MPSALLLSTIAREPSIAKTGMISQGPDLSGPLFLMGKGSPSQDFSACFADFLSDLRVLGFCSNQSHKPWIAEVAENCRGAR